MANRDYVYRKIGTLFAIKKPLLGFDGSFNRIRIPNLANITLELMDQKDAIEGESETLFPLLKHEKASDGASVGSEMIFLSVSQIKDCLEEKL